MDDIALRVEGLGKRYRIGLEQSATAGHYRYKSLRDNLGGFAHHPWQAMKRSFTRQAMNDTNSFWALHEINFEVKRGEVVGIIGRNGAGKSTLLKILSRITKPTTGSVELFGRVGSLLEVGTGFHPELTGRENIFLNGAILGMTQAEVKSKFDQIVAFSEVEKFLDTPVKQYSSGMHMRLAFAVAAHLEQEILIVDEVLAVGDAEFQKKCVGKMKDVAGAGRTVLFVSHNMAQLERLCGSGLLLERGRLKSAGSISDQITAYSVSSANDPAGVKARKLLPDLELLDCNVDPSTVQVHKSCDLIFQVRAITATRVEEFCVLICDSVDTHVAAIDLRGQGIPLRLASGQRFTIRTRLEAMSLVEREYQIGIFARSSRGFAATYGIIPVQIVAAPEHTESFTPYAARDRGFVKVEHQAVVDLADELP